MTCIHQTGARQFVNGVWVCATSGMFKQCCAVLRVTIDAIRAQGQIAADQKLRFSMTGALLQMSAHVTTQFNLRRAL